MHPPRPTATESLQRRRSPPQASSMQTMLGRQDGLLPRTIPASPHVESLCATRASGVWPRRSGSTQLDGAWTATTLQTTRKQQQQQKWSELRHRHDEAPVATVQTRMAGRCRARSAASASGEKGEQKSMRRMDLQNAILHHHLPPSAFLICISRFNLQPKQRTALSYDDCK